MKINVICNNCKKVIETVEKESYDFHSKDYCKECKDKFLDFCLEAIYNKDGNTQKNNK